MWSELEINRRILILMYMFHVRWNGKFVSVRLYDVIPVMRIISKELLGINMKRYSCHLYPSHAWYSMVALLHFLFTFLLCGRNIYPVVWFHGRLIWRSISDAMENIRYTHRRIVWILFGCTEWLIYGVDSLGIRPWSKAVIVKNGRCWNQWPIKNLVVGLENEQAMEWFSNGQ